MIDVGLALQWVTSRLKTDAKLMCRRIYDAVAHRRMIAHVGIDRYRADFSPDAYIEIRDADHTQIMRGWIKRVTVIVDRPLMERMKLEVDTVWESYL